MTVNPAYIIQMPWSFYVCKKYTRTIGLDTKSDLVKEHISKVFYQVVGAY